MAGSEAGPLAEWEAWLSELPLCLLQEIPRPASRAEPSTDPGREQRLAALVAAYHGGGEGVLLGWLRSRPAGPVEVAVGGAWLVGEAGEQARVMVNYPPGARGRQVAWSELLAGWRRVPCWTRLGGMPDVLALGPQLEQGQLRPSLEDSLLGVWHQPFCWLLLAQPVGREEVARLTREVSQELRQARARSQASQDQKVEAERLEARHRELRQAESLGLWRLHLLAGAESAGAVRRLAGLLAASSDLTSAPYVLVPSAQVGSLDDVLAAKTSAGEAASPFLSSSRLLAALARPPAEEVPGVRLALRPQFDVTLEAAEQDEERLVVGQVLDRNGFPSGPFSVSFSSLNRHTFVCGATGAGKSQTVRSLLEQVTAAGLPWLVVEPAKAEYRLMGARLGGAEVIAIRPGDADGIPAGINPLQPERGFPLQTHVDLVRALFLAAFEAEEPFPQVLSAALTRCYEQLGWDLTLSEPRFAGHQPRQPTLADLQRAAREVVHEVGYGPEVTQNVRGFIEVRLSSLRLGTTGRFFEGGHPIDFARLMARNVVLEIEDVGDDRDKAFLMGTVLVRLVEHLRVAERERPEGQGARLRHVSVFEEAHRLLRRSDTPGPAAHAVELFAGLLAEIRAYGEGLVVAEQIPSKLVPDVVKNTAVKVVHRLPARDDREAVGATMNVTDAQSDYLVTLRPGTAAVFSDGMDYPVLVQMPDGTSRETSRSQVVHPGELVGRCSPACGQDCRARPCTLREMREALRVLDDQSVVLWAELAVLGHLIGWPAPVPKPDLRQRLRDVERRQRECAIAQAVTSAVDSRAAALVSRLSPSPADLIGHVAGVMQGQIEARAVSPVPPEHRWLAEHYRWRPLWRTLLDRYQADPKAGRHPDSERLERLYGRPIPGATCRQQLMLVQSWIYADRPSGQRERTLRLGAGRPSAIELALDRERTAPDWGSQLRRALSAFELPRDWPVAYLVGEPAGGKADDRLETDG